MVDVHGNAVDPELLETLIPGKSDYMEAQRVLGSPSSKVMFDSEHWLYLHSKQERIAFLKPKEIQREIVVLKFDTSGVLQEIEKKDLSHGRQIEPSPETERTDKSSMTILDQMIHNVGRMNTDTPVH